MKESEYIRDHSRDVLQFLKERFPMFHNSNIFFRDMHYGVREYLHQKGMKLGYSEAEDVTREFIRVLEGEKILVPVDQQTWTLYYEEFRTPAVKPPEAPKPAPKPPPAPPRAETGEKT